MRARVAAEASRAGRRDGRLAADGEVARVVALFAYDVGQEAATSVYEPVAHLVHGQASSLGQVQLFVLGRVRVVAVLVQPHLEHFDALFGKIAAPFSIVD